MNTKKLRQYIGLFASIVLYFVIHEGAHLLAALIQGVFKQINFMGLGVQVDVYRDQMSDSQLGWFCIAGPIATCLVAYLLVIFREAICSRGGAMFKAVMYYITMTFLFADPAYIGFVYKMVGGGDMNGICLIMPELAAQILFLCLFLVNGFLFWKLVLPSYTKAFQHIAK